MAIFFKLYCLFFKRLHDKAEHIQTLKSTLTQQIQFQTLQADRYRYSLPHHAEQCLDIARQAKAQLQQLERPFWKRQ
ncbi:hypothetical protein COMNV_01331 [Commensalibacter sp. Nvir]|nr:hypothetical protein COMNV_01331 [Commensalibacter sp. Nvir]